MLFNHNIRVEREEHFKQSCAIKTREKWQLKWQEITPKTRVRFSRSHKISRGETSVYTTVLILSIFHLMTQVDTNILSFFSE